MCTVKINVDLPAIQSHKHVCTWPIAARHQLNYKLTPSLHEKDLCVKEIPISCARGGKPHLDEVKYLVLLRENT